MQSSMQVVQTCGLKGFLETAAARLVCRARATVEHRGSASSGAWLPKHMHASSIPVSQKLGVLGARIKDQMPSYTCHSA